MEAIRTELKNLNEERITLKREKQRLLENICFSIATDDEKLKYEAVSKRLKKIKKRVFRLIQKL